MRFILAFLLASSVAFAAPPKLSITANRSAAVGSGVTVNVDEPVTIELSTDANAKLAVFVVPKIHFDSTRDGRKVIFFAKQSVVFLVAAFGPSGEITKSEYTVTVSGTPVPIPPDPGPDNPPQPIDPTLTGLSKATFDSAMKVVSPTRAADAVLLSKVFRNVASQAAGLASMTPAAMLDKTKSAIGSATTEAQRKAWNTWETDFNVSLKGLQLKANDRDGHIKAWNEVAAGLEAAAKSSRKAVK